MPPVISSVSSTPAERDVWKRAATIAGVAFPVWCREALNAGAEAAISEADAPPERPRVRVPAGRAPVDPSRQFNQQAPYVPPELPPLPIGAKTAPEPVDMDLMRQRGLVASFIRSDGKEWRGSGATPLMPGCIIRADVLAEFVDKLDGLRGYMDARTQETAAMRASGVPV